MSSIDVIIPSYKPDQKLQLCLERLQKQTVKPRQIWVINTEEEFWDSSLDKTAGLKVIHIRKEEFDHGGTRRMAAGLCDAEFMMLMTQDAVPADRHLVERLYQAFDDPQVAAAYARQLPDAGCGEVERFTRLHNYPQESCRKTREDKQKLGIKTYSCSNVCAMYRKSVYDELGGFVEHTIFNEDMIMAAGMIEAGYAVVYTADAMVHHSHKYTYRQQFRRNFDLGVSQKQYEEVFARVPSESAGIRLVKATAAHLMKSGKAYLLPDLVLQSGFKYMGYVAGKSYDRLPQGLCGKWSMSPGYFKA